MRVSSTFRVCAALLAVLASCGACGGSPDPEPSGVRAASPSPVATDIANIATPVRMEIVGVATEFAAGGSFRTTDEAEEMVGYRLLRPDEDLVLPNDESGSVDVFAEIGLPRVRQGYTMTGKTDSLALTQEPESYPDRPHAGEVTVTFGAFTGSLLEERGQVSFEFLTGEDIDGVPIRALVASFEGYSRDDIRVFVEALAFAE